MGHEVGTSGGLRPKSISRSDLNAHPDVRPPGPARLVFEQNSNKTRVTTEWHTCPLDDFFFGFRRLQVCLGVRRPIGPDPAPLSRHHGVSRSRRSMGRVDTKRYSFLPFGHTCGRHPEPAAQTIVRSAASSCVPTRVQRSPSLACRRAVSRVSPEVA